MINSIAKRYDAPGAWTQGVYLKKFKLFGKDAGKICEHPEGVELPKPNEHPFEVFNDNDVVGDESKPAAKDDKVTMKLSLT
jgi:hypothetical protein